MGDKESNCKCKCECKCESKSSKSEGGSSDELKDVAKEAKSSIDKIIDIAKKGKEDFTKIISSDIVKAVVDFGKESIKLASNLQDVQNIIDTAFPNEAKSINEWAKNAINAFGMSEFEAKQFSITMGNVLKSMGFSSGEAVNMSQKIVGLAGD